ncbi:HEAT repeat domain-containing protein [Kovacikia minuta CCNUW1]|uniref:HEAT repeat domain-containing protein n=1 Tax=Kovacikia minuta TaxID=2931930 RepID=UPI001CCC3272|nr:HEAT repeat domain-containing protein [Kovacikia minuta]UBF25314.1 HEAT repeat domain-containing protein [Kovacikia minuta CCNUW1]
MSALLAILSFVAAIAAFAAGYRVWEKRSTTQKTSLVRSVTPPPAFPGQTLTSQPTETATLPLPVEPKPAIAQVELAPPPAPAPAPEVPIAPAPTIPDPWAEEPIEDGADSAPLSSTEANFSPSEVVEPASDFPPGVTASVSDFSEPVTPIETDSAENLSVKIQRLGQSGQINQVAYIVRYANHPDRQVRSAVAKALGILAINWRGTVVEGIIPVLGKLSRDSKPEVRLAAVEALGNIRSDQVLPWLQRAQQSSEGTVRKAATTSLQRLKLNYYPKPTAPVKPKLEKPKQKR